MNTIVSIITLFLGIGLGWRFKTTRTRFNFHCPASNCDWVYRTHSLTDMLTEGTNHLEQHSKIRKNHYNDQGDLIVEQRTLFRQVGWLTQSGKFYAISEHPLKIEPESFAPVYQEFAVDNGFGWED